MTGNVKIRVFEIQNVQLILIKSDKIKIIQDGKKKVAQRGARTHDPEIKSLMLYRLS
jgi:hypothetical protein